MSAEAATHPSHARLPSLPDFLRAVFDLGRRSIRPALPALGFLYFYRLGLGAYMTLSDYTYPMGKDPLSSVGPQVMVLVSFVPMLILVWTPFLPLQDSLLRGTPMTFLHAIRRVLEASWNFVLSGIAQALVLMVPAFVMVLIAATIAQALGVVTQVKALVGMITVVGVFLWMVVALYSMCFATPAVVLDGEGPIQSLRTSVRLVTQHLGGIFGRLFVFFWLTVFVYMIAAIPSAMLGMVQSVSGGESAPLKMASIVWSSAVDAIFFPFWVASLMVLYRSLVPYQGDARAAKPVTLDEEYRPASAARAPFE